MNENFHIRHCVASGESWWVGKIVEDGSIEGADFTGPNAEKRAREYALWKYGNKHPGSPD